MKCLLNLLFIFGWFIQSDSYAQESDLNSMNIITPITYNHPSSKSQSIKSSLTIGVGKFLDVDVENEVNQKINSSRKDLEAFYNNKEELDKFIKKVVVEAKESTVDKSFDDANLIAFYGLIGKNLIGGFADQILKSEGVTDSKRRELWVKKLLVPFNDCIAKSKNSQYDASHCTDALTASLVPTVGLAIVYELSKSKLSDNLPEGDKASFLTNQVTSYNQCLTTTDQKSEAVNLCALTSMKNGILKVTETKVVQSIKENATSTSSALKIKANVWPLFNSCIQNVGSDKSNKKETSTQFMDCIDRLVKQTGIQIAQDKILNTPAFKFNFNKEELKLMSQSKTKSFGDCIDNLIKNDIRKDGMIDIDKCETPLTNELTYKIVTKTFSKNAETSFPSNPEIAQQVSKEGKRLLDLCWNDKLESKERESCLRKTILSLAQVIGKAELELALPNTMANKTELTKDSLIKLNACLQKELPLSISDSPNLTKKIDKCSNQLTLEVAQTAARDILRAQAISNNIDKIEIENLIASLIDKQFMGCLGTTPSSEKIHFCSGQLTTNASIQLATIQIKENAKDKLSQSETENLIKDLITDKFTKCLGSTPTDTTLNSCVAKLTTSATKSIVLAYEKKEIKNQLNTDLTPTKLKPIEDHFIACVDAPYLVEDVSKNLALCNQTFALEFAKTLGELKLDSLMKSALGTEGYNDQKSQIDETLAKYNICLDKLKATSMSNGLIDKITICTNELQAQGTLLFTTIANAWMSSPANNDPTVAALKSEFSQLLPCLGSLLPSSPYSQNLQENVASSLKPVTNLIAQYIEYDPENARQNLNDIVKNFANVLKDSTQGEAAKTELLDLLYRNGALDQFIKAFIRGEVKKSFADISEDELPSDLKNMLTSKENFDLIFSSPEGKEIKDLLMDKIIKPILINQTDLHSPEITASTTTIQEKVTKILINAPSFGSLLIKSNVQKKLDQTKGLVRFFAKAIYGRNALNWDKVRETPEGIEAEEYIRNHILIPKFNSQTQSAKEAAKINVEAEALVKKAIKKYKTNS